MVLDECIQSYPQIAFPSLIVVEYHATYNQQKE